MALLNAEMTFPNKEIVYWFGLNQRSRHLI